MAWLAGHFAILLMLGVGFVLAVMVTQQCRSPQSSLAWLLAFVLVPYVAVPLFLFLGFRKKRGLWPLIDFDQEASLAGTAQNPLEEIFAASGLPPARSGHTFTLLDDPQTVHQAMFQTVSEAQHNLSVVFYIISNDPEGRAFLTALTDKAREGVKVRLLLDWLGAFAAPRGALRAFQDAGGHLRYAATPKVRWNAPSLNFRNHRKMIIGDSAAVFAGGMNVGEQYMTAKPDALPWTDLSFTLRGPAVGTFLAVFRSDWLAACDKESELPKFTPFLPQAGVARAQLAPSGSGIEDDVLHDALVHAIHCARARVWLATPYYLPSDTLNEALLLACKRGIDVVVMTPAKSNQSLTDLARGPYLREIPTRGGKALLHPRMLHAKMGVIDETAWVGSANFDMRSMLLNDELALFLTDPLSVGVLTKWFEREAARCHLVKEAAPGFRKLVEGFFRLLAPIL